MSQELKQAVGTTISQDHVTVPIGSGPSLPNPGSGGT